MEKHKTEVAKLSVNHFAHNPLHKLLPVPENHREEFFTQNRDVLVLAYHEDELVGFRTASILTYKTFLEVNQNNK